MHLKPLLIFREVLSIPLKISRINRLGFVYNQTFIILPVATPTKATYYAGKLSSHTTRFTFFILYYQHISQVFM
jgi:hypothetical protein